MIKIDYVFTDGHAVDSFSCQYDREDINSIDKLIDKNAIDARYWNDETDLDLKRRKEAEFLVLGDVERTAVLGFLVYSQAAKNRLIDFGANELEVHVKPDRYF